MTEEKQQLTRRVVIPDGFVWHRSVAQIDLSGRGPSQLLDAALTAFFSSRQSPPAAIRVGLAWAMSQIYSRAAVISGFQSPLERSVLELLLEAGSPTVVVLARPVESARLPASWVAALEHQHLAVTSAAGVSRRIDVEGASMRNEVAAQLARSITIAHADPNGQLKAHAQRWRSLGKVVNHLVS